MTLSRRKVLSLIGGGAIVATGATAGVFVTTRTPHVALAPWAEAGTPNEPRLRALSYAILAPNPHNRQPWLAELSGDDVVVLHRDKTRSLPMTDPYARQLTIGMGCFIELMVIAARQAGHSVTVTTFPDGPDGPVALCKFVRQSAKPEPLFEQVLSRRSTKEPFTDRPVSDQHAEALQEFGQVIRDDKRVTALRKLTWDAWQVESFTPRTMNESVDLMRFGRAEIEANPDGIDLGGPFLETLMLAGVVSREAQRDPTSSGFKEGVKIYQDMLGATPAYIALTTATNIPEDHIAVGRRWLRLNLTTTKLGLALHPVSQALQEFPEMAENRRAIHDLLAKPGETIQMLGRLGYGPAVPRTPRWSLQSRMLNGKAQS